MYYFVYAVCFLVYTDFTTIKRRTPNIDFEKHATIDTQARIRMETGIRVVVAKGSQEGIDTEGGRVEIPKEAERTAGTPKETE